MLCFTFLLMKQFDWVRDKKSINLVCDVACPLYITFQTISAFQRKFMEIASLCKISKYYLDKHTQSCLEDILIAFHKKIHLQEVFNKFIMTIFNYLYHSHFLLLQKVLFQILNLIKYLCMKAKKAISVILLVLLIAFSIFKNFYTEDVENKIYNIFMKRDVVFEQFWQTFNSIYI